MSGFTSPVTFSIGSSPGRRKLNMDVTFYVDDNRLGEFATLRKGDETNGITVHPSGLKQLMMRLGFNPLAEETLLESLLHDRLVGESGSSVLRVGPDNRTLSWKEAAYWFKKALLVRDKAGYHRIPRWKIELYYSAILAYGVLAGKK